MIIDFKKLREIEGVTADDIAETLGISQSYASMLLNGKRKMSKQRWTILKSKYCNITNYVIDCSNATAKDNDCNITEEEGSSCNNQDENDDKIPSFVLKMHNEERKRFDAQMDKMLEQNKEMLQQNRILVEALREQTRFLNGNNNLVADQTDPHPYNVNEHSKDKQDHE